MKVREQLLQENSRANADRVLAMIDDDLELVVELMGCFLSDEVVVAQRASQVFGDLGRRAPDLLLPWLNKIVDAIEEPIHQAIRRNGVRFFSELDEPIPPKLEARLISMCGGFVADRNVDVAIGAFSMSFVADRCDQYPEAAKKLCDDLRDRMPDASSGFANRARKVIKQLEG
jgi:hypothetical protein